MANRWTAMAKDLGKHVGRSNTAPLMHQTKPQSPPFRTFTDPYAERSPFHDNVAPDMAEGPQDTNRLSRVDSKHSSAYTFDSDIRNYFADTKPRSYKSAHYHNRRHSLPSQADLARDINAILSGKDEQEQLAKLQAYTLEASLDPRAAMTSLVPGISRTLIPIAQPKPKEKQRSITKLFTPLWRRPSISPAFNTQHVHHVSYDEETGRFIGLPEGWARLLQKGGAHSTNSSNQQGGGHWDALIQPSTSAPMTSTMPPQYKGLSTSAPSSPTTSSYPYPLSYPHLLSDQEKSMEEEGSENEHTDREGTKWEMMTPERTVKKQTSQVMIDPLEKGKKRMTMYSVAGSSISDASRYRKPAPRPDSFTSTTPSVTQPESAMSDHDMEDDERWNKKTIYGKGNNPNQYTKSHFTNPTDTRPPATAPIPIPARPSDMKMIQRNEHGSGTTPRPLPPLPSPYYTMPQNQ
ncbi:hypothetical protein CPB86DRAFT_878157 [Serendipita vermifera]|nr:hypothetical protein CPB86DRAFT_878157 [Serendipita vermifera]